MKKMVSQILEKVIVEKVKVKKSKKIEKPETQVDELLGDLNPKYFEETMTPQEAKNKIYSSRNSGNFSFIPFR